MRYMDKIAKGYSFLKFDFEEFKKDKQFGLIAVKEKYRYDAEKRQVTNDYLGLEVTVGIVIDGYDYSSSNSDGEQIGLNEGVRFIVLVEDAKKEDFEEFVPKGFDGPTPIEIVDVTDTNFKTFNNDNTLSVTGKVNVIGRNNSKSKGSLDNAD